jgi:hypothetical protein
VRRGHRELQPRNPYTKQREKTAWHPCQTNITTRLHIKQLFITEVKCTRISTSRKNLHSYTRGHGSKDRSGNERKTDDVIHANDEPHLILKALCGERTSTWRQLFFIPGILSSSSSVFLVLEVINSWLIAIPRLGNSVLGQTPWFRYLFCTKWQHCFALFQQLALTF